MVLAGQKSSSNYFEFAKTRLLAHVVWRAFENDR